MKIPSELLPKCSHCGKAFTTNLRADGKFVQDEGWYKAIEDILFNSKSNGNSNRVAIYVLDILILLQ